MDTAATKFQGLEELMVFKRYFDSHADWKIPVTTLIT